jgi:translocation and assembly module TamB
VLRGLFLALRLVLLLGILLVVGLFALPATETGSRWLVKGAARVLADAQLAELDIGRVEGRLLGRLTLHELALREAGAAGPAMLEAGRFSLHWDPAALFDGVLHLRAVEASDLRVELPPAQDDEPAAAPQIPDIALPLRVRLDRLELRRLELAGAGGSWTLDHLALGLDLGPERLRLHDLDLAAMGAGLSGSLEMAAAAPHLLDGKLRMVAGSRLTGPGTGPVKADLALSGPALRPTLDLRLREPQQLRLHGDLVLDQVEPGFDLAAEWDSLAWPLRGEPAYRASDGRLRLEGSATDYRLTLDAGLAAPDLPPAQLALDASGDLEGLRLVPLQLRTLDGSLTASGSVGWKEGVRWDLALDARDLDPVALLPGWPGSISGSLALRGSLADDADGLQLAAQIERLAGELRGYPVSASGRVAVQGKQVEIDDLRLASGSNRVAVSGRVGERLDLGFELDAPELAALYPGLEGSVQGRGRLAGTLEAPAVEASLQATGAGFAGLGAEHAELVLDWGGVDGSGRLSAGGVELPGVRFEQVALELDGSQDSHALRVELAGPILDAALDAQGGLAGGDWVGSLRSLRLDNPDLGEWRLREPATLRLGPEQARSGRLCMVQDGAALCSEGGWAAQTGLDLEGSLRDLDLARIETFLAAGMMVKGKLAADWRARGTLEQPRIEAQVRPSDGRIRFDEDEEVPLALAYRDVRLDFAFADDRGNASLGFELAPNGRASGSLRLGPAGADGRALDGRLDADFPDLALLSGVLPGVRDLAGRLEAGLRVSGTTERPQLSGQVRLREGRAEVPDVGITLENLELAVDGTPEEPLRVTASLRSGDGNLSLEGTVDLAAEPGPSVDLALSGSDFQAVRLPEARVLVSPDLRLSGAEPYRLRGTLRIPEADIELKELPQGSVSVSDDAVVIEQGQPRAEPTAASRMIDVDVRVELGDAVRFEGFGLSTRLAGSVEASVDQRGTLVDGRIELVDGRYKAYGQDLSIDRGRLVFAGPPGRPELDVRAVRVSRDGSVRAYLSVTGPASRPQVRVHSEPALPEAEALAYLLTGRGLDQAGNDDGIDITNAALSLGLSRSEPLLQDLSSRLGLDEFKIEAGENGFQESALTIGTYLNPDLYLGYTMGLFTPERAVLLRLHLNKHLEVETRSGEAQSVDLFYRYEHD